MASGGVKQRRAVTRADVARYAQVSSAVVSYVVNEGPKKVAPATAARVREAIEVLGYSPNISARSLKRGTTEMLGLVLPDIGNPFFADYAHEVTVAAADQGYALLVATSEGRGPTETQLVNDLVSRRVDGLMITTVWSQWDLAKVRHPDPPTVLLNCPYAAPGYASVGPAALEGTRQVVGHLIDVHGHRSIGLVMGESSEEDIPPVRERGWLEALASAGLPPGPIGRRPFTREGGHEIGLKMLTSAEPPSAIFASSDLLAIGVLRAARELSLNVPNDVALVSFDGTSESEYCWPPLTVTRQPVREMAKAAVRAVLDPERPLSNELFDMELVIRNSCGC